MMFASVCCASDFDGNHILFELYQRLCMTHGNYLILQKVACLNCIQSSAQMWIVYVCHSYLFEAPFFMCNVSLPLGIASHASSTITHHLTYNQSQEYLPTKCNLKNEVMLPLKTGNKAIYTRANAYFEVMIHAESLSKM